jgi:Na+-translocating ferredoxin:NAD+ oxidoreductase subunit D
MTKAPFIHSGSSITAVMGDALIALLPATAAGIYYFGLKAAVIIGVSAASCVLTEFLWQVLRKKPATAGDLSAVVTGLLLALTLPPGLPWWLAAVGGVFAVAAGKLAFGGLGRNLVNPALAARAFLQLAWPHAMMSWTKPFEAVTTATPLTINRYLLPEAMPTFIDMLTGNRAGSIGETCVLALAAGAVFLIIRKDIFASVPLIFIGTVGAGAFLAGQDPLFHMAAGGLVLGAFFMATDPVTSPVSTAGKVVFALGCGALTVIMRVKGFWAEGVCFSILIMNLSVPLLDRWLIPGPFGTVEIE